MKHPVTISLAIINSLVFLFFAWQQQTVMFSDADDFLALFWAGANFNPFTLDTQPWRLFYSMFIHGNIFHLLVNMYALYNIGHFIEQEQGSLRFLLIYFIAGLFAGLASLMFGLFKVSVGASGAIFGLYGYHILSQVIMHWKNRDVLINIIINFFIFAVINWLIASHVLVDTAAHIGGLVSGALIALVQMFDKKLSPVTLGVILMSALVTIMFLPKHQVHYYKWFQSIIHLEDSQRNLYKQKLTDNELLDSMKTYLGKWDETKQQIKTFPRVPEGLHHDTSVLHDYITLRKNEMTFRVKMIERESYIYLDSIEHNLQQFGTLEKLDYILNYRTGTEEESSQDSVPPNKLEKVRVLYDSNWIETDDIYHAAYYRIGERDSLGRWQNEVRDYYRDGLVQMKGKYLNDMHHGVFLYYTKDQKYESAGRYEKDLPVGKWEYYYPDGRLHREVVYSGNVYVKNVYDTTGNLQVENGYGKQITWFANGKVKEEGLYEKGWRQGIWRGYFEDGSPHYEEFYRDNILVRGQAVDRQGNRYVYDQSSLYASPEIGIAAFKKYLQDNVKKSESFPARRGTVTLHFLVDVNGGLRDFVVTESSCMECNEEAIRLVTNGPKWRPALSHGHLKIRSQGYAEVEFE